MIIPLLALSLSDDVNGKDEEEEFDVEDVGIPSRGRKNGIYHPGGPRAFGYNPLGTTDFDNLVQKTNRMYPGRVWVCTLRNKTLKRFVPGRDKVTVKSTRYYVEVKVGYSGYHLEWDSGKLNKIAQMAKYNRSLDTKDPSNKFKGLIYDYETILGEVSCGWKANMYKGGFERAEMSNTGLRLLADQWRNPLVIEGVLKRLSYSGTSIAEFIKYPSVQIAIGYGIMEGVMRAFNGSLEGFVPRSTLYTLMRE